MTPLQRNVAAALLFVVAAALAVYALAFIPLMPYPRATSPSGERTQEDASAAPPAPAPPRPTAPRDGRLPAARPYRLPVDTAPKHALTAGDIAQLATPSVVCVTVLREVERERLTGIVIDADGVILTAAPAVAADARYFANLSEGPPLGAELLAADLESGLAVLRVRPGRASLTALQATTTVPTGGAPLYAISCGPGRDLRLHSGTATDPGRAGLPLSRDMVGAPILDGRGALVGVVTADPAQPGAARAVDVDTLHDFLETVYPNRVMLPLSLATLLKRGVETGTLPAAIAVFRRAVERAPDSTLAAYNLGVALGRMPDGRPDAIAAYRRALALDAAFTDAALNLALLLAGEESLGEAAALLQRVTGRDPEAVDGWLGLGEVQRRRGNLHEAERAFLQVLAIDEAAADAAFNLGVLYAQENRDADAVRAFTRYLALRPEPDADLTAYLAAAASPETAD